MKDCTYLGGKASEQIRGGVAVETNYCLHRSIRTAQCVKTEKEQTALPGTKVGCCELCLLYEPKEEMYDLSNGLRRSDEPVGDFLTALLKECGVPDTVCEGCKLWTQLMNSWGIEGCVKQREAILQRLRDQSATVGIDIWAMIGLKGYFTSGMLLDEAIRRTKEYRKQKEGKLSCH